MRLFRVLVRLKIFQLSGVAALAIPITTVLSQASCRQLEAAGGLVGALRPCAKATGQQAPALRCPAHMLRSTTGPIFETPGICAWLQGEVSSLQGVIAAALVIGSGVASTALWYYSRWAGL